MNIKRVRNFVQRHARGVCRENSRVLFHREKPATTEKRESLILWMFLRESISFGRTAECTSGSWYSGIKAELSGVFLEFRSFFSVCVLSFPSEVSLSECLREIRTEFPSADRSWFLDCDSAIQTGVSCNLSSSCVFADSAGIRSRRYWRNFCSTLHVRQRT